MSCLDSEIPDEGLVLRQGIVAGIAAGLMASWVLNRFQAGLSALVEPDQSESGGGQTQDDDATEKAASAIGAISRGVGEAAPGTATAWGQTLGTALWPGADEIAVPALGLSRPPTDYPTSVHASAPAAHLVYGMTTDVVRRAIRAVL